MAFGGLNEVRKILGGFGDGKARPSRIVASFDILELGVLDSKS